MPEFDLPGKIAKLLEKASAKGVTPEEAATLEAHAERLIAKYQLDRAVIESRRQEQGATAEPITEDRIYCGGIFAAAYQDMLASMARGLGLGAYFRLNGEQDRHGHVIFVGHRSDVAQAMTLGASLMLQAASALAAYQKANKWIKYEPSAGWIIKKNFIRSFGAGVESRLRTARRMAVQEFTGDGSGAELVLVTREKAVEQYMAAKHPGMKSVSQQTSEFNYDGYEAGLHSNTGGPAVASARQAVGA